MVIEQQITGAIITGIKELYGADVAANQVQLQKTKKEFKGHLMPQKYLQSCFSLPPHVEEISGTDCPGNWRIPAPA